MVVKLYHRYNRDGCIKLVDSSIDAVAYSVLGHTVVGLVGSTLMCVISA